jgi:membrane-bound metal-dependent hydrolase YbcI (DUF457 family)
MLLRTHFSVALCISIFLAVFAENKIIFFIGALIATFLPDIDSGKSRAGKHLILRPLQWMTKHRGVFHTLLLAIVFSALLYPIDFSLSLGFFIGYCIHLGLDCLTKNGCRIFWPVSNLKLKFFISTGGILEEVIFVVFLLADFYFLYLVI